MKYGYLFLLAGLCSYYSNAQKITFERGYVVNQKGDTVRGEIKYNSDKEQDCYSKAILKDGTGALKTYNAKKAKAYGFSDQVYIAMDFEGEPRFYRVLTKGEIIFYKMMIDEIRMNQVVLGGAYFVAHGNDEKNLTNVKEGKFKKQMLDWMKDNTEFVSSYEDEKKFNETKALELVKNYNAWKAGQSTQ